MNVPATVSGGGHVSSAGVVRLRLDIAYDGTEFAGWAVQDEQRTVAGVLEAALSTVFRSPIRLFAAGRTDTGVHARGQVANVQTATRHDVSTIVRGLNGNLPEDVAALEACAGDKSNAT